MQPVKVPLRKLDRVQEGALLLVDKPLNWTSFDVVNKIRYFLKKELHTGKIKVGHAGTLDPLATGLLAVCIGKFTKRISEIQRQQKEYKGMLTLGASTPSYDLETVVDKTYPLESITHEAIKNAAKRFEGTIQQVPPSYSAVRTGGVRAYEKARDNQVVKLDPRTVQVDVFRITKIRLPHVGFEVTCSTGTYIRSLVHDFGKALNNGAHLTQLVRTRIGPFNLKDAWRLEDALS